MTNPTLTADEASVLARLRVAASEGTRAVFGSTEIIRPDVLRAVILGRPWTADEAVAPVHERGLIVEQGIVEGELDLENTTIACPLTFVRTIFLARVDLAHATTRSITFDHCKLSWVFAPLIEMRGDLDLVGSVLAGEVRVTNARIGGDLKANGARLNPDNLPVADDIAPGEHDVRSLDTQAAGRRWAKPGYGLRAQGATIEGIVEIEAASTGRLRFASATINGSVSLDGSTLTAPRTLAPIPVDPEDRPTPPPPPHTSSSGKRIRMLRRSRAHDEPPPPVELDPRNEPHALLADNAVINGSVSLSGKGPKRFLAHGLVQLKGTEIAGSLMMRGSILEAHIDGRAGPITRQPSAMIADGLTVGQSIEFEDFYAKGRMSLAGARIGAHLIIEGASFDAGPQPRQSSSSVERADERYRAITLRGARIGGDFRTRGLSVNGPISLRGASVDVLDDDPRDLIRARFRGLILDGFTYNRLANFSDHGTRRAWLCCQRPADLGRSFKPQPWEQLIRVLTQMGHMRDARVIAMKREAQLRRKIRMRVNPWPVKPLGWIYKIASLKLNLLRAVTVGHGYQPWLAVVWILAVSVVGSAVFGAAYDKGYFQPAEEEVVLHEEFRARHTIDYLAGDYPAFNPVVYTIDTMVPFADLHQKRYWLPRATGSAVPSQSSSGALGPLAPVGQVLFDGLGVGGWLRVFHWVLIGLGWLLTTFAVAGFTGIMKASATR